MFNILDRVFISNTPLIALPANDKPMIAATGPVTTGGRISSILFLPNFFTTNPTKIEINPDNIIAI